jgi:diphosphomevalonate decarboxylase
MTYYSAWQSPSNIALIKYWGKHGLQFPRNPSLSFTLSACHTIMKIQVSPDASTPGTTILYNGHPRPSFEPKIKSFFSLLRTYFPWLDGSAVVLDSSNTFPHGAGIASSASAMSSLSLCLMDVDDQIWDASPVHEALWWRKASEIARLGSGSACRSVYPVAAVWGETTGLDGSNDSYAIPWGEKIAPVFRDYQDTILIVSSSEKSVSSSAGHILMEGLPYARIRYTEARKNINRLMEGMQRDDGLDLFISVVESEALQLHALMMSGDTPFMLIEPGTISIIKEVWRFRKESGIPVCFTLDAGPNVHLLYPLAFKERVLDWINSNLVQYCAEGKYILDQVGMGPEKII